MKMEDVKVTKNSIVLKKKQSLADNASRTDFQETDPVALRGLIREELASRGLIEKDEHGYDTPYYIEVKPPYIEIRSWTSRGCVSIDLKTKLVFTTNSLHDSAVMQLSYNKSSFDDLAGICANMTKDSIWCDTFFHSASELRWYLYDRFPKYKVTCNDDQVIVSDRDGYIVLSGAGHGPQPYLIDADGHRIDIKGDYEKPGVWPAIKRFCRRLDYGKDHYLPYPITLDDLIESVESTMAEHGPGWQPVLYESLAL